MKDPELAKNIVKSLCEACGITTQTELAQILDIKQPSISGAISSGKIPSDWINKICAKLGKKPSDIMKRAYALLEEREAVISEIPYREQPQHSTGASTETEQTGTSAAQDFRRTCIGMLEPIIEYIAESYGTRPSDIERFKADFVERMPEYRLWLYGEVGKKQAGGSDKDGPSK